MTCIVALAHKGKVYMGGDSAGVSGMSLHLRKDPKVFVRGPLVMGYTSSFRMGQVLRFSREIPEAPHADDLYRWMCTTFIDGCRKAMKDGGYLTVNNSLESGGTFLVGVRGRIFHVDSDFQVGEWSTPFCSVGCGDDLAVSAMAVSKGTPEHRIKTSLQVAEQFSAGVRAPFVIVKEP